MELPSFKGVGVLTPVKKVGNKWLVEDSIRKVTRYATDNETKALMAREISSAPLKFAKTILQGSMRSGGAVGLSLTGRKEFQPEKGTLERKAKDIIFGKEPLRDVPGYGQEFLRGVGATKLAEKPLATMLVGGGLVAMDFTTGGKGDDIVKFIAKSKSVQKIAKVLKTAGVATEKADELAPMLTKVNDVNEVRRIVSGAVDVPQPLIKPPISQGIVPQPVSQPIAQPIDVLNNVLRNTLKNVKQLRPEVEKLQTAELAKRAGALKSIYETSRGESALIKAKGALKGELIDRSRFIPDISGKITPEIGNQLFDQIAKSPAVNNNVFDIVNAQEGLSKLLKGELPQPHEISLLEDVFGEEFAKLIVDAGKRKDVLSVLRRAVVGVLNIFRALQTTADMSATLIQGGVFSLTRPREALLGIKQAFTSMFSEAASKAWYKALPQDGYIYGLAKSSGLEITNPHKISTGLAGKEEMFMTDLVQKIPIIKNIVGASERAYAGYLNKLRYDTFKSVANSWLQAGIRNDNEFKSLARFINNATGRAGLGKLEALAPELNVVLYSARNTLSRINLLLNPVFYMRLAPHARKFAAKTMLQYIGTGTMILGMAKIGGLDVESDPRSSDFGKIIVGNTRYNIWGGFQPVARAITQFVTGTKKKEFGGLTDVNKDYPYRGRTGVASDFARSKLAPIPGLIWDYLETGKPKYQETWGEAVKELFLPMILSDMTEIIEEQGIQSLLWNAPFAFLGGGIQTFIRNSKPQGDTNIPSFKMKEGFPSFKLK